jgi:molecular chaperone GrpE
MANNVNDTPHMNDDEFPAADPATESVAAECSAADTTRRDTDEPAESGAVDPTAELARTRADLDETRQKNVRLQAELENFRKRTMRTMDEERRYASLPLLRDLLPVVDNLQRAITAAEMHENASGLLAGVKMVADQLTAILQRHHCEPIAAEGAAFDPHLHEAIAQHPSAEHLPGHVCLVAQVGYQLHDRVVRPAQVIVAAPRPAAPPAPDALPDPEI